MKKRINGFICTKENSIWLDSKTCVNNWRNFAKYVEKKLGKYFNKIEHAPYSSYFSLFGRKIRISGHSPIYDRSKEANYFETKKTKYTHNKGVYKISCFNGEKFQERKRGSTRNCTNPNYFFIEFKKIKTYCEKTKKEYLEKKRKEFFRRMPSKIFFRFRRKGKDFDLKEYSFFKNLKFNFYYRR